MVRSEAVPDKHTMRHRVEDHTEGTNTYHLNAKPFSLSPKPQIRNK